MTEYGFLFLILRKKINCCNAKKNKKRKGPL